MGDAAQDMETCPGCGEAPLNMAMHPRMWQATLMTVGMLQADFPRKNKITINLCDDGTLQLPEFVSGARYCCRWVYFIF